MTYNQANGILSRAIETTRDQTTIAELSELRTAIIQNDLDDDRDRARPEPFVSANTQYSR